MAPLTADNYAQHVHKVMPKSKTFSQCVRAFFVGGLICILGQGLTELGKGPLGIVDEQMLAAFTPSVLVFLGALLTGLGVYDRIGHFAGMGSILPITGFANSMVAPAMEFKREGFVMGVGAKMFTVAGPVLAYGCLASVVCGIIGWIFGVTV